MTFAVIDWLSISINLLLVIFVVVCLLMTLLILMQRPKQEGLGAAFGGGVTDQVFGARTTNVLQRGTVYLASLFFILALTLAVLIGRQNKKTSMLAPETPVEVVAETVEVIEEATPKSLSEELPTEETAPADAPAIAPETVPSDAVTPEPQAEPAAPAAPEETRPVDSEEKSEQP